MQWLRLYHDTITDEKWRVVANESGQPVGNVLAVWMSMLINASNSSERGTLEGWQDRYVAANLGYPTDAVRAIREAMQGVVLDGDRLSGWDSRQRASDDAGGRQRKTRERREPKPPGGGGHGGNGHDPEHSATVARQDENVARHSNNVATNPLRAQTPDSEKERKEESVCVVGVDPRETHTETPPDSLPAKTNIVPFVKPSSPEALPDGWVLPDEYRDYAVAAGWNDVDGAAEKFANHWLGKRDRGDRDAANSEAGWLRQWKGWINGNLKWERDHGKQRNDHRNGGNGDFASYVQSHCAGWVADAAGGSNPW